MVVKLLFIRGSINPNSKDKYGAILLLLAIEYGREVVVKLLLTRDNVNLNPKSALKETLLL